MESKNTDVEKSLFNQLEQKGIEQNQIPLFIKDLMSTISLDDSSDLLRINDRLHVLGWIDFELDYHTLQLTKAYIENEY